MSLQTSLLNEFLAKNWIALAAIAAILLFIWLFERKKFGKEGTLFYIRRTKRGLQAIDRAAKKRARWWIAFGEASYIYSLGLLGLWFLHSEKEQRMIKTLAIGAIYVLVAAAALTYIAPAIESVLAIFEPPAAVLGPFTTLVIALGVVFGAAGFGLSLLFVLGIGVLAGKVLFPQLGLALPFELPAGLRIPVISIPLLEWFLTLFVILVAHEFCHALVARAQNVRVKSIGYGFLGPLPLGFAEIDEKQLERQRPDRRARIVAAGSGINFVLGVVFLAALFLTFTVAYSNISTNAFYGTEYEALVENRTLPSASLPAVGHITSLNGIEIKNVSHFRELANKLLPNQTVFLRIDSQDYTVTTVDHPLNSSRGYLGIRTQQPCSSLGLKSSPCDFKHLRPDLQNTGFGFGLVSLFYVSRALFWLALLNLGVSIFNLLPAPLFDGGTLARDVIRKLAPKGWKNVAKFLSFAVVLLILLNIFGPLFSVLLKP